MMRRVCVLGVTLAASLVVLLLIKEAGTIANDTIAKPDVLDRNSRTGGEEPLEAAQEERVQKGVDIPSPSELVSRPNVEVPSRQLRNIGHDTPAACVETALWASLDGDVETLASIICIPQAGRGKIDAYIGTLPKDRSNFRTAEEMVALAFAFEVSSSWSEFTGFDERITAPGEAVVTIRGINRTSNESKSARIRLKQSETGWQIVPGNRVFEEYDSFVRRAEMAIEGKK